MDGLGGCGGAVREVLEAVDKPIAVLIRRAMGEDKGEILGRGKFAGDAIFFVKDFVGEEAVKVKVFEIDGEA